MLSQRWARVETALGENLVFSGYMFILIKGTPWDETFSILSISKILLI